MDVEEVTEEINETKGEAAVRIQGESRVKFQTIKAQVGRETSSSKDAMRESFTNMHPAGVLGKCVDA